MNLARIRLAAATLLLVAESVAEPATAAHGVAAFYALVSAGVFEALARARAPLPVLWLPAFDLAAAVSLTLLSNLTFIHFFPIFVLVSTAYRAGVTYTIVSGVILAGVLALESHPAFAPVASPAVLRTHILVLSGYTLVAAVLIGHLATRERGARSESAAIGRLFERLRLDAGPVAGIKSLLEALRGIFGARQVLLVVDDTADDLALLWRGPGNGTAGGPEPTVKRLAMNERGRYWFAAEAFTGACLLAHVGGAVRVATAVDEAGDVVAAPRVSADAFLEAHPATRVLLLPHLTVGAFRLRLIVLDPHVERADQELRLLQTLSRRVAPIVHNLYLERHLRTRLQAHERERLARELHDGVIQSLIAVEMRLDVARRQVEGGAAADVSAAQQQLRDQIVDVRTLMNQLRPPEVRRRQLLQHLSETTERFREATGIEATFVRGVEQLDVPTRVCGELVRVVDEALMNVRKHSGASRVDVRLGVNREALTLSIEDDGRGFDFDGRLTQTDLDARGLGPVVIKERVHAIGGRVAIDSARGRGTRLEVRVPWPLAG